MTPIGGEENQEINDIPVIEENMQNESGPMEHSDTKIRVRVEIKITDEKRLIIDELKAVIIRNGTKEYLPFNNVDQGELRDVTKKVNELIRHIETDDVTQTNKQSRPLYCKRSWSEEKQNRREKRATVEKKN